MEPVLGVACDSEVVEAMEPVLAVARDSEVVESQRTLPDDPLDVRLTLEGAVVGKDGRINTAAYEDLHCWYAGEPSPDKHPLPEHPGVRRIEEVPKGLRIWDNTDISASVQTKKKPGAGWMVVVDMTKKNGRRQETQKWFNIQACGSWRLAFLLAKLQRDLWEHRGVARRGERAPRQRAAMSAAVAAAAGDGPSGGAIIAVEATKAASVRDDSQEAEHSAEVVTPRRESNRLPSMPASSRKRRAEQWAETPPASMPQPLKKTKSSLDLNSLSASVRLQQVLAARADVRKQ